MTELGETDNPQDLIQGNPGAIEENARVLLARSERADDAASGLKAIDSGSWEGEAARAFHEKFSYEPGKWYTAATCLGAGATALDNYAGTLRWAQGQATEALRLWNQAEQATQQAHTRHDAAAADAAAHNQPAPAFDDPGAADRQAARDMLTRARTQVTEAADIATGILRGETQAAPEESDWLEDVGDGLASAGGAVVNGVASFGNAMINNPGEVLAALGGIGLTAVSAVGATGGIALDATGVGAVAGVPLTAVSAAGMATGAGITGVAIAGIASHAAGDDRVEVFNTNDDAASEEVATSEEAAAAEAPREITGLTQHGEEQAMGRDSGRGVSDEAMKDAVENPTKPPIEQSGPKGTSYKYVGQDATVVLNQNGQVITTWARNSGGLRNSG